MICSFQGAVLSEKSLRSGPPHRTEQVTPWGTRSDLEIGTYRSRDGSRFGAPLGLGVGRHRAKPSCKGSSNRFKDVFQ